MFLFKAAVKLAYLARDLVHPRPIPDRFVDFWRETLKIPIIFYHHTALECEKSNRILK
jgi:hypothetical protein